MRVERRDDENDMRLCIVELRLKEKWHDQYYSRGSLVLYFTVQKAYQYKMTGKRVNSVLYRI